MSEDELREAITEASNDFTATIEERVDVKEIIYLVAYQEEGHDGVRMITGSTKPAPQALRTAMLNEALTNANR